MVFLATGKSKASIISEMLEEKKTDLYPAGLVNPLKGRITWLLDNEAASSCNMISIIIPALNEADNIGACIESLLTESGDFQIIVADGGSSDRTREIAAGYQGITIVDSGRGRGMQMNRGASVASGEILLFLHADTVLEQGWSSIILSALENPSIAGGAFTFAVDNPSWKYRLVEAWVKLRCSLCDLPYGDQAIFARKYVFVSLKGYRNIPLMEDVDLVERMRKIGRIAMLDKKAFTSERRWAKRGLIGTAATNQVIMTLYKLGVSPERLFELYYR